MKQVSKVNTRKLSLQANGLSSMNWSTFCHNGKLVEIHFHSVPGSAGSDMYTECNIYQSISSIAAWEDMEENQSTSSWGLEASKLFVNMFIIKGLNFSF